MSGAGGAAGDAAPARILVVEDDPQNRALLRAVLARGGPRLAGATLDEAGSLAAAREAIGRSLPDVVVLDMRLPDGSGRDLARELAVVPDAERPRVLILSASVLPAERDAALAAGCDAFLAKPYRPVELIEVLVRLLGGA